MTCNLCGLFQGDPCRVCRTYSRIGYVISTGQLHESQEAEVLSALRICSGAIQDLGELATRIKKRETLPFPPLPVPGPPPPGPPLLPKEEEVKVEKKDKDKKRKSHREKLPKEEKSKSKKVKEERSSSEGAAASSGVRDTPASSGSRKKRREEDQEKDEVKEEQEETEEVPVEDSHETPQAETDRLVESYPDTFGLGVLPHPRSTEPDASASSSLRPREPAEPPPLSRRRYGGERTSFGGPRKKNKGQKHRQRGRNWSERGWWR